jgi:alpha-beta hydrolase superfamily lysophospholipase
LDFLINFVIFKGKSMNYSIKLKNGHILKGFMVSPGEQVRANVIFVHGLGEHIQRYSLPWLAQPSGLVAEHISHDKEVVGTYITDPLVHDKISVSLFHSAMSAAGQSLEHAAELTVPLLLMHGSDDMICSPEGSREFAARTSMAELKIWEGGYHELHNEPFKNDVFAYIMNWINLRLT